MIVSLRFLPQLRTVQSPLCSIVLLSGDLRISSGTDWVARGTPLPGACRRVLRGAGYRDNGCHVVTERPDDRPTVLKEEAALYFPQALRGPGGEPEGPCWLSRGSPPEMLPISARNAGYEWQCACCLMSPEFAQQLAPIGCLQFHDLG
jgi:hypothetical protein